MISGSEVAVTVTTAAQQAGIGHQLRAFSPVVASMKGRAMIWLPLELVEKCVASPPITISPASMPQVPAIIEPGAGHGNVRRASCRHSLADCRTESSFLVPSTPALLCGVPAGLAVTSGGTLAPWTHQLTYSG